MENIETKLQSRGSKQTFVLLALLAVYIFWGGTYLGMRVAVETIPPFLMAGLRFFTAGLILYIYARLTGAEKPKMRHWLSAGIIGAMLLLGANGVIAWAEQMVPSGIAALLVATVPLWMIVLGLFSKREKKPTLGVIIGIFLGLCGMGVLVSSSGNTVSSGSINVFGIAALIFAALSWSIGSLYSRRAKLPKSTILSAAMQNMVGGGLLIIVSLFLGEWQKFDISAVSSRSIAGIVYLIVFGSIVGYNSYIWLLKNGDPALVSTYAFVNPIVAVLLGWIILGEQFTSNSIIALVIIIASIVIITYSNNRKKA